MALRMQYKAWLGMDGSVFVCIIMVELVTVSLHMIFSIVITSVILFILPWVIAVKGNEWYTT